MSKNKPQIDVIEEGNKSFWHKHDMQRVTWDKTLGKDFEELNEYHARYKSLFQCSCGRKVVVTEVAFI